MEIAYRLIYTHMEKPSLCYLRGGTMRMLLGALLALMALTGLAESRFTFDSTPGGLPKTVMPTHYDIHIRPDLAAGTIAGRAGIDIEVREPVQELVLNALDIKVTRAVLDDDTAPSPTTIDANAQTLKIPLTAPLSAGKHRLNIEYTGKIATYGRGLYQLKYKDGGGERVMLATEMEPTDARRLFPCWDEPSFRATFALKAVLPEAWRAVSNMPVTVERTLGDGLKEVAFDTTPSMATYLVALFAGDLEELTSEVDGVKLGIWTARGRRERAGYAMEVTKQVLHYYNDYFGQPYPLPKLDQIALPGGRPGAMENWGAISYEESGLLFDPAVSSLATLRALRPGWPSRPVTASTPHGKPGFE